MISVACKVKQSPLLRPLAPRATRVLTYTNDVKKRYGCCSPREPDQFYSESASGRSEECPETRESTPTHIPKKGSTRTQKTWTIETPPI